MYLALHAGWLFGEEAGLSASAIANALLIFEEKPMGHPRLLKGLPDHAGIISANRNERSAGVKALGAYLRRKSATSLDSALSATNPADFTASYLATWSAKERALEGLAEGAVAWFVTGDPWYSSDLKERMKFFGPPILANDCRGDLTQARAFAWHFALAYDFAYPVLSAEQRELAKNVVKACVAYALPQAIQRVSKNPRDGIAFNSLARLTGALMIMLGEFPEASGHAEQALRVYLANLSPWGGKDGGFANGSSYFLWDVGESLLIWDLVDRVLGLPIYQKAWVSQIPTFLAYTLPPGTPAGVFGDGAEVNRKEEWARFGKAIMSRFDTPLARWYENQLFGEDGSRLHILLSPWRSSGARSFPEGLSNSALFPSVGWAAMHSSLSTRSRVSVYFKSSPFGSYNHSHADQNSFLLYAYGNTIAMDSGHYDYYGSPHWKDWYKQTKAHNAVTYDNGQGQQLGSAGYGSLPHSGLIERFDSDATYDLVTGDATRAYGNGVLRALRSIVFFRQGTVVVIDQMQSISPRTWEWNFHTPVALNLDEAGYRMKFDEFQSCLSIDAPTALSYTSRSGYTPAPKLPLPTIPMHHWHSFSYGSPSSSAYFVAVIRADCSLPAATVTFVSGKPKIIVENREISLSGSTVIVK